MGGEGCGGKVQVRRERPKVGSQATDECGYAPSSNQASLQGDRGQPANSYLLSAAHATALPSTTIAPDYADAGAHSQSTLARDVP